MDGRPVAARAAITAHNLALESELLRVHAAFVQAGIQTVVLKGLPLMRRIGEEISQRRLADNDLLVHREDVRPAAALLAELGYEHAHRRPLDVSLRTGSGQHPMVQEVAGHRLCVELHWEAFHPPFIGIDPGLIWSHAESQVFRDQDLLVFDRPLTLVHTAAHFVWHAMGQPRLLRTLGHAWMRFRDSVALSELRALAHATGTLHALDFSLRSAQRLSFAEGVPNLGSSRARALERILPAERLLEDRPNPDYDRILLSLLLLSPRRAAWHMGSLLVPAPTQAAVVAGSTSPGRIALHYLGRPTRTAARWLRYRFSQRTRRSPED